MILVEKYNITNGKNEILNGWTKLFNDIDELINFFQEHKKFVLGSGKLNQFKLVIRDVNLENKGE